MTRLDDVPSTSITCPRCKVVSHLTPKEISYTEEQAWVIQACDHCVNLVLTIYDIKWQRGPSSTWADYSGDPINIFPYYEPTPDPSIPEEIADDYSEAVLNLSAGAYNSSVVMCRRALETAAILNGANPNDRLVDQITYLSSKGLEQSLIDLSTEIRLLGNTGAHVDKHDLLRNVTRDEARDIIDFLEQFLEALYVRPARIAALRKKRGTP